MSRVAPAAIRRGWALIGATPRPRAPRVVVVALGLMCAWACLAGPASAGAASFTWVGEAATPEWSKAANWSAAGHPAPETSVAALVFPHLLAPTCAERPPPLTCYAAENDLPGLSVGEIQLDDADEYELSGDGLTLGAGGIVAEGTTGLEGFPALTLPIQLGASQSWLISGGPSHENGVVVSDELSGSESALTVALKKSGAIFFGGAEVETGDVTIDSSDGSVGFALLAESAINESDGHSLTVRGVPLEAFNSATGALVLENPVTLIGTFGFDHETGATVGVSGTLATEGAAIDGGELDIPINGAGSSPGHDYSQLTSTGPVSINGSRLDISDQFEEGCPAVPAGRIDTLISVSGELSGSFTNAPDGTILETTCLSPSTETIFGQSFRIDYHRGSLHSTVTATAIEAPERKTPEEEQRERTEHEVIEHVLTLQKERLARERVIKEREQARVSKEQAEREGRERAEAQAIAVMLGRIVPSGKGAKISVLLKKGFSFALTSAGPGSLTISWYEVPHGAHLSKHAKPVLVATGSTTFAGAGTGTLLVKMTAAGKRLLRHAKKIALTAKGTFTRTGKPAVEARKTFALKR